MLKIVDLHLAQTPSAEYVVLQNQGLMTVDLHGWVLCSEKYLLGEPVAASRETYVFTDHVSVKPYGRVVLFTGAGISGWYPTTDGKQAYVCYWGQRDTVWDRAEQIHLLYSASSRKVTSPNDVSVGTLV